MGEQLRTWRLPEQVRQDALLILSELVTNAIRHTPSTRILCCAGLTPGRLLHLEVHDEDITVRNLPPRDPSPEDECGRGLLLVEHFADEWGTERSAITGGNTVWAAFTSNRG
jgi:anti-sigma regulatory factor (Ser/Thr protein kinase)